jgi:hypothetical protein
MQNTNQSYSLSSSDEITKIGIKHLLRYWQKCQLRKTNTIVMDTFLDEWNNDIALLGALGLGLEQTIKFVYNATSNFETFENWILQVNNSVLDQQKIKTFNDSITVAHEKNTTANEKILTKEDIAFWDQNGYVIIRDAITKVDCSATVQLICNFLNIDENDATTWYNANDNKQGIMVQLFQHPILEKNRNAVKIKMVYEQLWQRKDIWVNTDRVGFNPPETDFWKFPGPNLHWDVSLKMPIPFGLQGILYLTDTKENQGAFTLVPGFHLNIEDWLINLPTSTNPRKENLTQFGPKSIEANAGDFIIWHHKLPHGSSINTSSKPRFVQYINYSPLDAELQEEWI